MGGNCSSNCTSTTAPMTETTRPLAPLEVCWPVCWSLAGVAFCWAAGAVALRLPTTTNRTKRRDENSFDWWQRRFTVKSSGWLISQSCPSGITNGWTLFTENKLGNTSRSSTGTSNALHRCRTRISRMDENPSMIDRGCSPASESKNNTEHSSTRPKTNSDGESFARLADFSQIQFFSNHFEFSGKDFRPKSLQTTKSNTSMHFDWERAVQCRCREKKRKILGVIYSVAVFDILYFCLYSSNGNRKEKLNLISSSFSDEERLTLIVFSLPLRSTRLDQEIRCNDELLPCQ